MAGRFPYFDMLLAELGRGNPAVERSFGRHVHWGYWDDPKRADITDEGFGRAAEQLTLELCALAGIEEGDRILDAGCGFGGTVASLNERYTRLALTGLNIEPAQLARARELVRPEQGNTIDFVEGDACSLPFADGSFDRLLAVECIFHFPSREAFFREAFRVLRPGGVLVLSDFVRSAFYPPLAGAARSGFMERYNILGAYDVRCTVGGYRRLAAETGFVPEAERNITRHTLPTYAYLRRLFGAGAHPMAGHLVGLLGLINALGLLNYYLLSFRKPSQ